MEIIELYMAIRRGALHTVTYNHADAKFYVILLHFEFT